MTDLTTLTICETKTTSVSCPFESVVAVVDGFYGRDDNTTLVQINYAYIQSAHPKTFLVLCLCKASHGQHRNTITELLQYHSTVVFCMSG